VASFGAWDLEFGICEAGWPTGLEPATTRTTIWGSTIELRPPSVTQKEDFRIRIFFLQIKGWLFAVRYHNSQRWWNENLPAGSLSLRLAIA
jgi:hypothetical protein